MRLLKLITAPVGMLFAALYPTAYAKWIGVNFNGHVKIYGSSYGMFGSEPYLVTLGNNVFISIGASFVSHDGATLPFRKDHPDLELAGPIVVGDDVFIGAGALLLPNVSIGNKCIVGARAVVTKSFSDGVIIAGNPARVITTVDEFLEKAKARSLRIGHLSGPAKVAAYKKIFGIK